MATIQDLPGPGLIPGVQLSPRLLHTEVVLEKGGDKEALRLDAGVDVEAALRDALAAGKKVVSVTPRRESLEDLFVRSVQ